MKFKLVALLVLFCGSGATLFGQELQGTWQGTLSTPATPLRIVAKITKADDGKFEGQIFSIDQGGPGRPMNLISLDGRTVKFKVDALSASYDGAFTAHGNAINGTMTQATTPLPLNLVRATPQTAWAIPEPPAPPKPMDPAADPGIEVATVKPSAVETRGRGIGFQGLQLRVVNYSLLNAITFAYDLHERQVSGGPAWMSTTGSRS